MNYLHLIVADLLAGAGAGAMQGKSPPTPGAGAAQAARVVSAYRRFFIQSDRKPLG